MTTQVKLLLSGAAAGVALSAIVTTGALLFLGRSDGEPMGAMAEVESGAARVPDPHAGHVLPQQPSVEEAADVHAGHAPAIPAVDPHAAHTPTPGQDPHDGHGTPVTGAADQQMQISPQRLQAIGVRFEPVGRRVLDRQVRTTGQVEIDERRLVQVTLKVQGWVETLHVNATGDRVSAGQPLVTIYSPDLLATQEEHLLALESARILRASAVPEVAARAGSLVEATRRRLQLWDIPDAQIEALERAGRTQRTLTMFAPAGGTVIERTVVQGAQLMPGDVLFTIADLSRVWVTADVYEHELPFVRVGQEARITLAHEPGVLRQGRVSFIYPTVDPMTRTARVRIEVSNPAERLKPGMFTHVDLAIPVGSRLVVPRDAVLDTGLRQVVFLHLGDGLIGWREVTAGVRVGDWVEILAGLREGEHVVTSPAFLLDSESRLGAALAGLHAGH